MDRLFDWVADTHQIYTGGNPFRDNSKKIEDWIAEGSDNSLEKIRILAGRDPELVPQAIEVLIQNGSRKALHQIGNLVVERNNSQHIPLIIEKGCAAGTEEAIAMVTWMAKRFPQYAPLVIRNLKTLKMPETPELIADIVIDGEDEMNPGLQTVDFSAEEHEITLEAIAALREIGTNDALKHLYQIAGAYTSFARRKKEELVELINFHVPNITGEELDRHVASYLKSWGGELSDIQKMVMGSKIEAVKHMRDQRAQALAYISQIMDICQDIGNDRASANLEFLARWDEDLLPRAIELMRTFKDHVAAWDISSLAYEYPKDTALTVLACNELLDLKADGKIGEMRISDDTFSGQLNGVVAILADPVNLVTVVREGDAQKTADIRAVLERLESEAGQWEKGALTSIFVSAEELALRNAKAFPDREHEDEGPAAAQLETQPS